jgi:hypothetical protein
MPVLLIGQPALSRRRRALATTADEVITEVRTSGYALRVTTGAASGKCEANLMDDNRIDD